MNHPLLAELLELHTYCRPYAGPTEDLFRRRFVDTLPGAYRDTYGNTHVTIGDSPRVLWSCHTDTVHWDDGRQTTNYDPRTGLLTLSKRSKRSSRCLGGDDTVGVFLCRQLVLAGVSGHYVFHVGEEKGGIGSRLLAQHESEWLESFDCAIALDRGGTRDVITHQCCARTASDRFAQSLGSALHAIDSGLNLSPSEGVYTDTAEYAELIPECTNLSVGYTHAHSSAETVDTVFVLRLLDALRQLNTEDLMIARDPSIYESDMHAQSFVWTGTAQDAVVWREQECPTCGETIDRADGEPCHFCGDVIDDHDREILERLDRPYSAYLDPAYETVQDALRRATKRRILS